MRSQDIRSGVFRTEDAAHVSEATFHDRINRAEPRYGDLLYSREGTYFGIAAEVPPATRVCLGQRMVLIRPSISTVHHRFLQYWLNSPLLASHVQGLRDGSVAERFNLPTIRGLPVPVPLLQTQKAIAHIVGTLDDKIELNRRMNATLEEMARVLFRSWFVDFDPVRAKAEGRQPVGMDAETAALFPDGFDETEGEIIPSAWRWVRMDQAAVVNGRSVGQEYPFSAIEYVDIASVQGGILQGTATCSIRDAPSRARRLVGDGDTIWSTVRPNRRSYLFIHEPKPNLIVSTGFAVLTPKAIPPTYLYSWVTTDEFVSYLSYNADGSAYPAVLPGRFSVARLLLPPKTILAAFEGRVGPVRAKIAKNALESLTLSDLRDLLLPRLLSGEIRVCDAERQLESVL
ncbi:MAG: restriction endonuclease subunit S [Chloroflexota bacterium]